MVTRPPKRVDIREPGETSSRNAQPEGHHRSSGGLPVEVSQVNSSPQLRGIQPASTLRVERSRRPESYRDNGYDTELEDSDVEMTDTDVEYRRDVDRPDGDGTRNSVDLPPSLQESSVPKYENNSTRRVPPTPLGSGSVVDRDDSRSVRSEETERKLGEQTVLIDSAEVSAFSDKIGNWAKSHNHSRNLDANIGHVDPDLTNNPDDIEGQPESIPDSHLILGSIQSRLTSMVDSISSMHNSIASMQKTIESGFSSLAKSIEGLNATIDPMASQDASSHERAASLELKDQPKRSKRDRFLNYFRHMPARKSTRPSFEDHHSDRSIDSVDGPGETNSGHGQGELLEPLEPLPTGLPDQSETAQAVADPEMSPSGHSAPLTVNHMTAQTGRVRMGTNGFHLENGANPI
jgi:hypothetical protein